MPAGYRVLRREGLSATAGGAPHGAGSRHPSAHRGGRDRARTGRPRLSSRNVYLSPEERRVAPLLYRVLNDTAAVLAAAQDNVAARLQNGLAALRQAGFASDYLELRDAADLSAMSRLDRGARLLAAAHL